MKPFFVRLDQYLIRLYLIGGYLAAACLVTIAILVTVSIVSRLLSIYVPGLTEYSGYAMAAASFFALAYTFQSKGHIRVEVLVSRLGTMKRWYVEVWCLSVASIVSVLLAAYLAKLAYWSWKFEEHSEGSDAILLWKPQVLAVVGSVLLAICCVHHLVKCLLSRPQEIESIDGRA